MLTKLLQRSTGITPTDPPINQDIVIIGGFYYAADEKTSNTAEKFNVAQGKSAELPLMHKVRAASASVVYNNDVIVAGGFDGKAGTDTIEILKMKQPLAWTLFNGKLPVKLSRHAVVVYHGNILIIGGYDWNGRKLSDAIYVVRLTPHYTPKLVFRMPQALRNHSAELVNDKLFILGGATSGFDHDATDSVFLYDAITREFEQRPPLPYPVYLMSTVTWENMIIVLGGKDKDNRVLNDVIMYDTETGHSKELPPMTYKRFGCSAVIMNDVIVVMGGRNMEQGVLNSVETLTIGSDGWKELPCMLNKRHCATAVVIPGN